MLKWTPKFSKKSTLLHNIFRTGGPEKIKKYDTSGLLFTGISGRTSGFRFSN